MQIRTIAISIAPLICVLGTGAQAAPADQAITSVVMHRSACYGSCPVYTIQVLANGEVSYEGLEHVRIKGHRTSHVAPEDFALLTTSIFRIEFFNLRENYRFEKDGCLESWTDHPTVDLVITRGGEQKHVSYYYGCKGLPISGRIDWLSKTIDEVANSIQWVGADRD